MLVLSQRLLEYEICFISLSNIISLNYMEFFFPYIYLCYMSTLCHRAGVEFRGQLAGAGSLLQRSIQGCNSGCGVCQHFHPLSPFTEFHYAALTGLEPTV